MKRALVAVLMVAGCRGPTDTLDDSLTPLADAGNTLDAGDCSIQWLATPQALAASPRANQVAEYLALEGAENEFVVGDATAARADAEYTSLRSQITGVQFIPENASTLRCSLDDAGTAAFAAGEYHDWDCLNRAYRAPPPAYRGFNEAVIAFNPIIDVNQLAPFYLALPHVTQCYPEPVGVLTACGYRADLCLRRDDDAGTWQWLGFTESSTCARDFYRLTTQRDGGSVFEFSPRDAGVPGQWFAENAYCAARL